MFKEAWNYLYLFKFKLNKVYTNNKTMLNDLRTFTSFDAKNDTMLNKINCDKLKAQDVLDNIYTYMINQGLNFFEQKHCCTI